MNLDDAQKKKVAAWITEGLKLSEIQGRLESEFGLRMTYMEVRFLVDDLKLVPKDVEPAKPAEVGSKQLTAKPTASPTARPAASGPGQPLADSDEAALTAGGVSVTVDQVARPGALVSGGVTFSDGQQAGWYLDQQGRLGVIPKQQGYKPSAEDIQSFQMELQTELQRMGL